MPDYVHLTSNESQMQLISMDGQETPSTSPCFNSSSSSRDDPPPAVMFIPGKGTARWWRNRSFLERALTMATILLLVLCIVLIAVLLILDRKRGAEAFRPLPSLISTTFLPVIATTVTTNAPPTTQASSKLVCVTPGCVRAANNLLNAMNESVDPCTDFFEFACGSWNKDHPIPDDMPSYGTFPHIREQVRLQMRVLLEKDEMSTSKSVNKARSTYRSCMNTSRLEMDKTKPLIETLKNYGKWPLINGEEWHENSFDLTDLMGRSRREYGVDIFYQLYVYADAKNTTRNILSMDQGALALGRSSREYYLNSTMFATHIQAYRNSMIETLKILFRDMNVTITHETLLKHIEEIIQFETELAKITVAEDERRNITRLYNKKTLADLTGYLPEVDWLRFFSIIAPDDMKDMFTNETEIVINEIEYMTKVSALLKRTDSKILANYIILRIVMNNVRYLDERFDDVRHDFVRVMTGQQQRSPRWKDCTQVPSSILPLAAGAIYVDAHFKVEDKKEAMQMIGHLRTAFIELVNENQWMDDATRVTAIAKVNSMLNNIGYPDMIKNITKLDKEYEELNVNDSDSYYSMMKASVVFMQNKDFRKLLKIFEHDEFDISPAVVNAFYQPERNSISFPAGILQPPFFSGEYPKAVNYGAMGSVIGHEITHGFDDQGSQYDKSGNLDNWWSEPSFKAFDIRRQCIVDQYSSYVIPGTTYRVNGKLTQGENIADNGGVKESFRAYRKYVKDNGEEEILPGMQKYTNEQIFFLSYAHFWCGVKKDAAAQQQVLTDEHSPEIFRVTGVLSNMPQFSDAFNCPVGAKLNPEKKCDVW